MYAYIKKWVTLEEVDFSNTYQIAELVIFSVLGFCIPLFIGHPQIVVGLLVNAFLISNALKLKGWKILPIILLPSLGVLSRGILFGPFTPFLLYMIPFIWIGNTLLVMAFRKLRKSYWISLFVGVLLKSAFLFLSAYILYSLDIIPIIFLTAMGILQVITGFLGGIASFAYEKTVRVLQ
ncbi:hypothetical protein JW968_02660 [Candidatus Woesearchaeota archaeon]|nr:hypothetical protein [Candidatus Woesearchaeota archaeon]